MSWIPGRTTSSRTIEAHTGTHIFEIDDYSQKKGSTGVGKLIRFSTFTVGGFNRSIAFYPNGNYDVTRHYIIVFLELMSSNVELRAHYNIQFIGGDDVVKDSMVSWYSTGMRLFNSSNPMKRGEYRPRHRRLQ
jgi:speckle-type POZ protein